MLPKLGWTQHRHIFEAGDVGAASVFTWPLTTMTWSKATTVGAVDYPRHLVRLHSFYALLTDSSVVVRDGSMITLADLGPRPTSLIELANVVQSPTARALWVPPHPYPVDIGLCVYLSAGAVVAAGDCLYVFAKFEDLGQIK